MRAVLKTLTMVALIGATIFQQGCAGSSPKRGKLGKNAGSIGSGNNQSNGGAVDDQKAFELTLYSYVRQNDVKCFFCHGEAIAPTFALEDVGAAYEAVKKQVRLDDPEASGIVQKVKSGHNVWTGDPQADGESLAAKIQEWSDMAGGGEVKLDDSYKLMTQPIKISAGTDADPRDENPGTIVMDLMDTNLATGTTLTGWTYTGTANAVGGKALKLAPNIAAAANAGATSAARYTFTTKVAGDYRIMLRGSAPAVTMDNMFYTLTVNGAASGTANTRMLMTRTEADQYYWTVLNTTPANTTANAPNQTQTPMAPLTGLAAGATVTIAMTHSDLGILLDMLALTNDPKFAGASQPTGLKVKRLSYDISGICGVAGAKFEVDVFNYNDQSYAIKNPAITGASSAVHVKKINVLVNGKPDNKYATFREIDATVQPNDASGGVLEINGSLVVLRDLGEADDALTFAFEECSGG